jgi:hypothetical protein
VQGFRNKEEVQRFSELMEEMCTIVATKHGGSLKASQGSRVPASPPAHLPVTCPPAPACPPARLPVACPLVRMPARPPARLPAGGCCLIRDQS